MARPFPGPVMALIALLAATVPAPAHAGDTLPEPKILSGPEGATATSVQAVMLPARRYYAFWNTGEERFAKEALAPDFQDLRLSEHAPQGPEGPLVVSRNLRQSIPDLALSVEEAWIAGDQIISRLHFTGHFTGKYAGHAGDGRPVAFDAVDIYRIKGGKIATSWRLEDDLALQKQMSAKGKVTAPDKHS